MLALRLPPAMAAERRRHAAVAAHGARVARTIPPVDLIFLLIETADTPMHVGGVMLFERPRGGAAKAVARIVNAYRAARPRAPFDQVPDFVATGMPRWRRVPAIDLEYHVQHLVLPPGATQRSFLRQIEDLHEPLLDRNRPGFRVWVIEGLPDGRFAIYFKVHHSLVDGISATVRMVASLATASRARTPPPFFAVDVGPRRPQPPPGALAELKAFTENALHEATAFRDVGLGFVRRAVQGLWARRGAGSRPFTGSDLPLNAPIRTPRSFATLALRLAEVRTVAHAFGGTINDVAAAIVDAGIHAYLADLGCRPAKPLVVMCPVSLRDAGDTTATTNASAIFVPLGEPHAAAGERMRQVILALRAGKDEIRGMSKDAAVVYAASVLGLAAVSEFAHAGGVTGHVANFVLSNVPGAREDRFLGGARLQAVFPVSVLGAGIGLNVTLSTHFDTMGLGFVGNRVALPDLDALAEHTRRAFDALAAAAFRVAASEWPAPRRRIAKHAAARRRKA
jgi:diacylglycerol O-acyltransferase / wax synthase